MNEENIYYIIEVCVGGEKLYMYSKRIAGSLSGYI